jgi:hypothetical protein
MKMIAHLFGIAVKSSCIFEFAKSTPSKILSRISVQVLHEVFERFEVAMLHAGIDDLRTVMETLQSFSVLNNQSPYC